MIKEDGIIIDGEWYEGQAVDAKPNGNVELKTVLKAAPAAKDVKMVLPSPTVENGVHDDSSLISLDGTKPLKDISFFITGKF